AYRVPAPTLTGDIQRDLAWIPEVIGVGEIAISDHRSSQPRQDELARLVSDARVGAMLAGKRGICHFHLGDGKRGLTPLRQLLEETELPPDQIIPTHVNRRPELLEEAADYALAFGASVDVTAFEDAGDGLSAFDAVSRLLARGVPSTRITLSSDCNGSLPEFDADITLLDRALRPQRIFVAGRCLHGDVDT
ncbi:MAG: beta-aspartyl-peptidase, partial [Chromohalobacter japonicus]